MIGALSSGLVAGIGIAMPVGAIGALLVSLGARAPWRVAVAAALGVAAADGLYATVAVAAGGAAADALAPVADALRVVAGGSLLGVAALTAWRGWQEHRRGRVGEAAAPGVLTPGRSFATFLGLTALNPATIVYFVALVVGHRGGFGSSVGASVAFVLGVLVASAAWQVLLATGGAVLGRWLSGQRGRLWTALLAATVVAGLAVRTLMG